MILPQGRPSFLLTTSLSTCGKKSTRKPLPSWTSTKSTWPEPTSSFFINAHQVSRINLKQLIPSQRFVWLKIRSPFSNLFRAYVARTTLRHRVLWPLWHLINVFLLIISVTPTTITSNIKEFCAHVETLETYGGIGAVGVTPTLLAAKLKDLALVK